MLPFADSNLARLLIKCPDRPGIIAQISAFLKQVGANITDSDQHSTDPEKGDFFMRLEFQLPKDRAPDFDKQLEHRFQGEVALPFAMEWNMSYAATLKRMAIFVSKYDHALLEILWRWSRGELPMEIPFICSNHPDLAPAANNFNIPFFTVPVTLDTKAQAEQTMLSLCESHQVDGLILARYMQILTPTMIQAYPYKMINIHHSFLPAFIGANPYQQAYDRGVKLIGATAHYVTAALDQGPIITQDVARVSHRSSAAKLRELGQHVERTVLASAVAAHLEDRVIVDGNKTIVFEAS